MMGRKTKSLASPPRLGRDDSRRIARHPWAYADDSANRAQVVEWRRSISAIRARLVASGLRPEGFKGPYRDEFRTALMK
jgi:hypothetical protein